MPGPYGENGARRIVINNALKELLKEHNLLTTIGLRRLQ